MLKYGALQKQLKTGDLLAFRSTGPISRFIRSWTGGSYSHVGIAWIYKGNYFILQDKEFRGVELRPLNQLLPCDWVKTGANWTDTVDALALAHLGQDYSYVNALRAGFNLPPLGEKLICSEFAVSLLYVAGVLTKEQYQSTYTPVQLINALLNINKPLQIITKG